MNAQSDKYGGLVLPFGAALRLRREKLGYSQEHLANLMGDIHPTTLSRMERSPTVPKRTRWMLGLLAEHLKGTPEELLAGYVPPGFPHHESLAAQQEAGQLLAADPETLETMGLHRIMLLVPELDEAAAAEYVDRWRELSDRERVFVARQFLGTIENIAKFDNIARPEPQRRGPGRPKGSRNKRTIERRGKSRQPDAPA